MENKKKLEAQSINQSINQSNELYLIQNENLKELLDRNPDLKKEVEETEKLINTKLKIKTIEKLDEIVGKITELGFKTAQEAKEKAEKLGEVKTEEELKYCLNAKKFCYYETALKNYWNGRICDPGSKEFGNADQDLESTKDVFNTLYESITPLIKIHLADIISDAGSALLTNQDREKLSNETNLYFNLVNEIVCMALKKRRDFYVGTFMKLIKLRIEYCLRHMRMMMIKFRYLLPEDVILCFLSSEDRYNFFQQFHLMLEKNLPDEDKQLFYDYLKSCREKLQNEKYKYLLFGTREKQLTAIVIFGIIASAVVLILSLFNIVNLMWLFYIGIVLTVAVGIRLFLCIKANCNYLQELENDLQKEGKTIQDKIAEIDRAIDVYDLDKIKHFKEPELKKISTIETDKNRIINNDEINSTEQNDIPGSEKDNSGKNIKNINNL